MSKNSGMEWMLKKGTSREKQPFNSFVATGEKHIGYQNAYYHSCYVPCFCPLALATLRAFSCAARECLKSHSGFVQLALGSGNGGFELAVRPRP
jgi:hypothetical protein